MDLKAEFLVRLDAANFYTRTDDAGEPFGTEFPSCAAHLTYDQADSICRRFRCLGYHAIVTDLYGQPVTGADLRQLIMNTRLYSIRLEASGLYLIRCSAGRLIGTRDLIAAFKAPLPLARAIAQDLYSAGYKVQLVENGDRNRNRLSPGGDIRKSALYQDIMGADRWTNFIAGMQALSADRNNSCRSKLFGRSRQSISITTRRIFRTAMSR